jgi:hypothetical protein
VFEDLPWLPEGRYDRTGLMWLPEANGDRKINNPETLLRRINILLPSPDSCSINHFNVEYSKA